MTTAADWYPPVTDELTPEELRALGADATDEPVFPYQSDNDEAPTPPPYDQPDPDAVKPPRRKRNAAQYERKLSSVTTALTKELAKRPETQPDAAILIMQGPEFCRAWGNAAAEHDKIARAIDWLSEPTDNALLIALFATAPILLQVVRNHEPVLQPQPRGLRVPFLKDKEGNPRVLRLPKVGVRLSNVPGYAAATNDPQALRDHVFNNPAIVENLRKQGVQV